MTTPDFRIEQAHYPEQLAALRAVREPVFIIEQSVPAELEWDELDPVSHHAVAFDTDGNPVGTGRLTPEQGIGRMAVLAPWRGKGVGAALLSYLIEQARALAYPFVELHAQTHAIGFYERFGFIAFGPEYDEAGIPHRSMRLQLAANGDEKTLHELTTQSELADWHLTLFRQARREILLYSRDLDAALLDNSTSLEALRQFIIRTPVAQLRVLVHDLRRAVQESHGLINLLQRLPSKISIRVVEQEPDIQYASAFCLTDQGGYVFRPLATRPEASACLRDPARQRQLTAYFNEVWERARPASELRPL